MTLAIFDLDNTLLNGDSDWLWGQFLVEQGIVDGDHYESENLRYYHAYQAGTLDIFEFLAFQLKPLADNNLNTLHQLRDAFMLEKIQPTITVAARELLDRHRQQGDTLMIITATNSFITGPIADELGVEHLLATEPELTNNCYSGKVSGTPCFRDGKVVRLKQWLQIHSCSLDGSYFYSDSHNDLPLLNEVKHPIAVDPDERLKAHAVTMNWPIISLRGAF
ncbi:MAG: HAD family hydrolase [Gammaproteobacteria bacterium]|nr:HAD family hydrolase [Gammaproteobacteria bacterium]